MVHLHHGTEKKKKIINTKISCKSNKNIFLQIKHLKKVYHVVSFIKSFKEAY